MIPPQQSIPSEDENNNEQKYSIGSFVADEDEEKHSMQIANEIAVTTMCESLCNYAMSKSKPLIFGQILAFWLAMTGAIQAKLHLDCHFTAASLSTFSFVFPLSVICLSCLIWKEKGYSLPSLFDRLKGRQQSSTSLSELDLSLQQELQQQESNRHNNEEEGGGSSVSLPPASVFAQTQQQQNRNRRLSRIRAKHEKRNHLLSRWSSQQSATQTQASNNEEDNQFYIETVDDMQFNSTEGNIDEPVQHTFFGLFPIHTSLRNYAIIAAFDVYANYTTILAYKYTTITSVGIFDALAIPAAIIVSKCFFGRRYTKIHYLGVLICFVGITINILSDYHQDKKLKSEGSAEESAGEQMIEDAYPHRIAGDILAILGGILFGVSNTLQEVIVKDGTLLEYFGCFSFFASIITFFQAMILEQDEIMTFFTQSSSETCSAQEGKNLFFLFAVTGVMMYMGIAAFLQISDAAFFNLSLLTGDAWAVVFSLNEGIVPPPSFFVALVITVSGVVLYETSPSPVVNSQEEMLSIDDMNSITNGDIQLTESNGSTTQREVDLNTEQSEQIFI